MRNIPEMSVEVMPFSIIFCLSFFSNWKCLLKWLFNLLVIIFSVSGFLLFFGIDRINSAFFLSLLAFLHSARKSLDNALSS